jgi:hypothetical protein
VQVVNGELTLFHITARSKCAASSMLADRGCGSC